VDIAGASRLRRLPARDLRRRAAQRILRLQRCGRSAAEGGLHGVRSQDRGEKSDYHFPDGGLCNDFITAADGTVYATDTELGRIIRLKPGATEPDVWASDPDLAGIDGIAFAGGKLYFNNVRKNLLQRIDIKPDGSSGAVSTLQLSAPINGPDGMRVGPGEVLLVTENRSGNLTQAKIEGDKATMTVIKGGFGQLTAIGIVGNIAWVAESKFALRNDPNNKDPGPWVITPVTLP
jgi:sugar lactone lactonase YvrE